MITLIIPITNRQGYENFKRSLVNLETDWHLGINVVCLVADGNEKLLLECKKFLTENIDLGNCLVLHEKGDLYKKASLYIGLSDDYVFLANENVVIPLNAITKLYADYLEYRGAGFITGVFEAYPTVYWVEDIYEDKDPRYIYSNERPLLDRIVEVDVSATYGILTKSSLYRSLYCLHNHKKYGQLSYGIWLRRQGYKNYIDTTVKYGENKQ